MNAANGKIIPSNVVRMCVDHYDGDDVMGTAYSKQGSCETDFLGIADFLMKMDQIMDEKGGPRSWQEKRSFRRKTEHLIASAEWKPEEKARLHKGSCATYDIVISSRMHTSWQGYVKKEEGKLLGTFESELKLIEIILTQITHQKDFAVL